MPAANVFLVFMTALYMAASMFSVFGLLVFWCSQHVLLLFCCTMFFYLGLVSGVLVLGLLVYQSLVFVSFLPRVLGGALHTLDAK